MILINPFYETTGSVREVLLQQTTMDISKCEKEENLLVIDALEAYFGEEPDREFKEKLSKYAIQIGKSGLSIINDTGAFPYKRKEKELVEYELSLPVIFNLPLKRFCIFHQKDFNRLSEEQKQKLINHHGKIIKLDK